MGNGASVNKNYVTHDSFHAIDVEKEFLTIKSTVLDELQISEIDLRSSASWINCSSVIYRKVFGEEAYHENLQTEFPKKLKKSHAGKLALHIAISESKALMGLATKFMHRRATHPRGVCARGTCTFIENTSVPSSSFFDPGRVLPVRVRHSSALNVGNHDGSLEPRGCAIKFADSLEESPFDLFLNTGELAGFFNVESFLQYAILQQSTNDRKNQEYSFKYPTAPKGSISSFRRAPDSYNGLHYYTQTCMEFKALDGLKRYCKFRAVPFGDGPFTTPPIEASGLPDLDDQLRIFLQVNKNGCIPLETETRPFDYLKTEFTKQVTEHGVKYRLQIQLWEWREGVDTMEVFNPNKEWNHILNPFHDIGIIELTEILPDIETERMQNVISRVPHDTIQLIEAWSPQDYNSLNIARAETHPFTQQIRLSKNDVENNHGPCKYIIILNSGPSDYNQRSGNLSLLIRGDSGETSTVILPPPSSLVVSHTVYNAEIGVPQSIHVGHDGVGFDGNWHCLGISIWCYPESADSQSPEYWFPCYGWVEAGKSKTLFSVERSIPQKDSSPQIKRERSLYLEDMRFKWKWSEDCGLPQHSSITELFELPMTEWLPSSHRLSYGLPTLEESFVTAATEKSEVFKSSSSISMLSPFSLSSNSSKRAPLSSHSISHHDLFKKSLRRMATISSKLSVDTALASLNDLPGLFVDVPGGIPRRVYDKFNSDEEFGRQMLNGCNPCLLKRCDELPSNFGVTADMVAPLLPPGSDLASEISAGHIYIADCGILEGIPLWDGTNTEASAHEETANLISVKPRYAPPAMALFAVAPSGKLMPIAIQLSQEIGSPVWTPLDNNIDWMLAKLYYRVSDSNILETIYHILNSHFVMESFAIAAYRHLAPCHPVMKLLHHHFHSLISVNIFIRNIVLGNGGVADILWATGGGGHIELMKKYFVNIWDYSDLSFPQSLRRRGVEDPTKLPGYYYRDDGLTLWLAMESFVRSILSASYTSDEDVREDAEIQGWIRDLHDHGLKGGKNVPDHFDGIDAVIECVTAVMWQCSAGHSAVAGGQYEHFAVALNAPLALLHAPPVNKHFGFSFDDLVKILPTITMLDQTIKTYFATSKWSSIGTHLGEYTKRLFASGSEEIAAATFQDEISAISNKIQERNRMIYEGCNCTNENPYEVPYEYLVPSYVSNSPTT